MVRLRLVRVSDEAKSLQLGLVGMARSIDRTRYTSSQTVFTSLREFLNADVIPAGGLTIVHNGIPIDILFLPGNGASSGLFMFHGAVPFDFTLPIFQGGGVTASLNTHRIFISDPTLAVSGDSEFDKGLTLSWYAGNYRQPDLQGVIGEIIRKFAVALELKRSVFYGISGGGFASLYFGSKVPGSVIVAINPQTIIENYLSWAVQRFANIAFGVKNGLEFPTKELPSHIVTDVREIFSLPVDTTVLYMQNSDDQLHINDHLRPFLAAVHPAVRVELLMDYWGPRHTQAPKELMTAVLDMAIKGEIETQSGVLGFGKASLHR